jgi:hypothetical protein
MERTTVTTTSGCFAYKEQTHLGWAIASSQAFSCERSLADHVIRHTAIVWLLFLAFSLLMSLRR